MHAADERKRERERERERERKRDRKKEPPSSLHTIENSCNTSVATIMNDNEPTTR